MTNDLNDGDVRRACEVLRNRLLTKDDVYYGFLASIESALSENLDETNIHDIAVDVLERIVGDEHDIAADGADSD